MIDTLTKSINAEKLAGTWKRNQLMRVLYSLHIKQADLGRWWHLSRERIRQIVHKPIPVDYRVKLIGKETLNGIATILVAVIDEDRRNK